jgi:hypothetical protein
VIDVQPGGVERAVGRHRSHQAADRLHAALAKRCGALDDEARRAHAHHEAVAATVERQHRVLDALVGGRGPAGQEAGAEPIQQRVAGDVVSRHHDHAAAAAGADPVLGQ